MNLSHTSHRFALVVGALTLVTSRGADAQQPTPAAPPGDVAPAPEAAPAAPEAAPVPATPEAPQTAPVEVTAPAAPPASTAEPTATAEPPLDPQADRPVDESKTRFVPGKGLTFRSQDKAFEIALRLRGQFLYTLLDEPSEQLAHSFQLRRARVQFGGHAFSVHNKYKVELALSPRDENVRGTAGPTLTPLLDWYAEFDYLRDLNLRVGQYKVPFSRQRVISSGDLQLVDRAIAQSEFNLDRDVGFHLFSSDLGGLKRLKYYAGAWINEGRDASAMRGLDMMYIARVEALPFGMFADYKEADIERTEKPRLSIGLAYAYLDDALRDRGILGSVPADEGTSDVHVMTVDAFFKLRGISLFGEFFLRRASRTPGGAVDEMGMVIPTAPSRDGIGWFVQAGYVLPGRPVEVAARYSEVRPRGDDSALEREHESTVGVSWYPGGHSYKLQADYGRLWSGSIGEGANQGRVQLQLAL